MLLSSHILSEVEALCDRVAILREGGWSKWGPWWSYVTSPRFGRSHIRRPVPDLSGIEGVSAVEATGRVVRCQVRGTIEPLLRVLAIGRPPADQPRALPGRAVPRALWAPSGTR